VQRTLFDPQRQLRKDAFLEEEEKTGNFEAAGTGGLAGSTYRLAHREALAGTVGGKVPGSVKPVLGHARLGESVGRYGTETIEWCS